MDNLVLNLKNKIMTVCEEHKIRLTPKEYDQLIQDYFSNFVDKVSIPDLIQLAENIKRRG